MGYADYQIQKGNESLKSLQEKLNSDWGPVLGSFLDAISEGIAMRLVPFLPPQQPDEKPDETLTVEEAAKMLRTSPNQR
jgi:hypothetical protein